jgi:hypothetical protein
LFSLDHAVQYLPLFSLVASQKPAH